MPSTSSPNPNGPLFPTAVLAVIVNCGLMICVTLVLLYVFVPNIFGNELPVVTTNYGKVQGTVYTCDDETKVNVFQGIPFAKPPVAELRLEKPEPPDPWKDTLIADKYSDSCVPYTRSRINKNINVSEDCLYLNIWTPAEKNNGGLPVAVFIHGGGFRGGSAASYSSEKFAEVFARRGIVFATIQYRLSHLGFMSLNNDDFRGNYGMWDQTLALKFIKDNIAAFGGNADRITILGESAGASSVGQLTLSPHSHGLFAQAFQMSGSAFSDYSRGRDDVKLTQRMVKSIGCDGEAESVKSCLKTKSVDEFLEAAEALGVLENVNIFTFAPMFDGEFFPKRLELLVEESPKIPTLFGLNMVEGRLFALIQGGEAVFPHAVDTKDVKSFTKDKLTHFIQEFVANSEYGDEKEKAFKDIMDYIERRKPQNATYRFWIEEFVTLIGDYMFNVPVLREAIAKEKAGVPVYAFKFDHFNQASWPKKLPAQGSTHGSEFPFDFEMFTNFNCTESDIIVREDIQNSLIGFFKTGIPTYRSQEWRPIGSDLKYLSVKPESEMKSGFFKESHDFWTKTMRKYPFDFISQSKWPSGPDVHREF